MDAAQHLQIEFVALLVAAADADSEETAAAAFPALALLLDDDAWVRLTRRLKGNAPAVLQAAVGPQSGFFICFGCRAPANKAQPRKQSPVRSQTRWQATSDALQDHQWVDMDAVMTCVPPLSTALRWPSMIAKADAVFPGTVARIALLLLGVCERSPMVMSHVLSLLQPAATSESCVDHATRPGALWLACRTINDQEAGVSGKVSADHARLTARLAKASAKSGELQGGEQQLLQRCTENTMYVVRMTPASRRAAAGNSSAMAQAEGILRALWLQPLALTLQALGALVAAPSDVSPASAVPATGGGVLSAAAAAAIGAAVEALIAHEGMPRGMAADRSEAVVADAILLPLRLAGTAAAELQAQMLRCLGDATAAAAAALCSDSRTGYAVEIADLTQTASQHHRCDLVERQLTPTRLNGYRFSAALHS